MKIAYIPNHYSQQRQRHKKVTIYPVLMAMEAQYYRDKNHEVLWNPDDYPESYWFNTNEQNDIKKRLYAISTGCDKIVTEAEGLPFIDLPAPDRAWTGAMNPIYQKNGNFKYRPGTYIQAARDCWWSKCSFCKWAKKFPNYEVRRVESVIEELIQCKSMGFKEVFDDSGTFPLGDWLRRFCELMVATKLNKTIKFSCNMRLLDLNWSALKRAGFRMILFGLESANQDTLDKINKGVKVEDAERIIRDAARAGLEPHVAVMVGYPWETDRDARRTIKLVNSLLSRGYAKTAQCSYYDVPGVRSNDRQKRFTKGIYKVGYSPLFWYNRIRGIRSRHDITYLLRGIAEGVKSLSSV